MADTNVENTSDKSSEKKKGSETFTFNIPCTNRQCKIEVKVEVYDDAAQLPRIVQKTLIQLPVDKPALTLSLEDPVDVVTHIILSTGSGHLKAETFFEEILEPILISVYPRGLHKVQKHTTDSESSILQLARSTIFPKADVGKKQIVLLLSGDGGIVDLLNGLLAKPASPQYISPRVLLFPLGTANALYHSLDPEPSTTWGLDALSSRIKRPLPIFTANFSPGARLLIDEGRNTRELPRLKAPGQSVITSVLHGAVVCSWGIHASLVADSDTAEFRKFGIDRFKTAAKEALFPKDGSAPHAYKAKISIQKDGVFDYFPQEKHMYVLSTMVSRLESNFTISPASQPLDGRMYLVYFEPTTGEEAMRILGLVYDSGKHVKEKNVRYEAIDAMKIQFDEEDDRWRRVCVDGKIVQVERGGWVKVYRREGSVVDIMIPDEEVPIKWG